VQKESEPFVVYRSQVPPQVTAPTHSLESIQSMIDTALDRQARASNELMRRLIEERDGKKVADNHANVSSPSGDFHVPQTENPPSVTSVGSAPQAHPQTQPTSHYHSQTTISGSAPVYGMPPEFMAGVPTSASLYSIPEHPTAAAYAPGSTSNAPNQPSASAPAAAPQAPNNAYNTTAHAPSNASTATTHAANAAYTAPQVTVPSPSPIAYAYGYPSQA